MDTFIQYFVSSIFFLRSIITMRTALKMNGICLNMIQETENSDTLEKLIKWVMTAPSSDVYLTKVVLPFILLLIIIEKVNTFF